MSNIPLGGRTKYHVNKWREITKDPFILNCIQGCKINFISTPIQTKFPHQINFNNIELKALLDMIQKLESENVIEKCSFEPGDYMNTVFLREKKSAEGERKYRMILNMKKLNKDFVELIHHKINCLSTCLDLMEPDCFMASLDLSNAFHTIPMHPDFTKFLKFRIGHHIYKYLTLPMGFRDSPRLFAKILKPVLSHLRSKSLVSSVYIDDFFLLGSSWQECNYNVKVTCKVLQDLGFEFSEKSVLIPTRNLTHLGFSLDSSSMTVSLGPDKLSHIKDLANQLMGCNYVTVRKLAQLIGTLVAALPGVEYGQLYYRELELTKIRALKGSYNFDKMVFISDKCKEEIIWWRDLDKENCKVISHGNPEFILRSDSSDYAWGAEILHNGKKTQGFWDQEESQFHINAKELKAVLLGVQSLAKELKNCHLQIQADNQTAVTYINNMGGTHSILCNSLAKELLLWCKNREIWLSACHIPGKSNSADILSRKINPNTEWSLNKEVFSILCQQFGTPEIDLFASRINTKVKKFMSFYPDPTAYAINAFAHKWDSYVYIFPPFNLICRILRKIQEDRTPKALMIFPNWTAAAWYPKLLKMCLEKPNLLNNREDLLSLPGKSTKTHPLFPKMRLLACILSGKNTN